MKRIDAHTHFAGDHPDSLALLDELDLLLLNVCVAYDNQGRWRRQADQYRRLAERFPGRYAWCTSFDPPGLDEPDYAGRVIEQLNADLSAGAVGCKVWKNVGLEFTDSAGRFVMVDDPVFSPIFDFLEQAGTTLLMHIGEPRACWQPLDEHNVLLDVLTAQPHLYLGHRGELPSHQSLIDARDRVLARHRGLRVVGAHLGSLDHDVAEIADRLERFPNFAVDTSARINSLSRQDPAAVREFFLAYPDRILFGTDAEAEQPTSTAPGPERDGAHVGLTEACRTAFAFFESDGMVSVARRKVQGLGLPRRVLEQLYQGNAQRWYPGLADGA